MATLAPMNIIYALHLRDQESDVRYVGQTSKGANIRLAGHFGQAAIGSKYPVCNWLRKHGKAEVVMTVLESFESSSELDVAESRIIEQWRELQGARLLNVKTGGGQSRGHKKTPEQIAKTSGKNNPMYGTKRRELMIYARSCAGPVSDATRAKMSESATGKIYTQATKDKLSAMQTAAWTPERRARQRELFANGQPEGMGSKWTDEQKHAASFAKSPLVQEDIRRIRKLRADGLKYTEIASLMPGIVSAHTVGYIVRGDRFAWVI